MRTSGQDDMNAPLITTGQDRELKVADGSEVGDGESIRCNAASGNLLTSPTRQNLA